jgi:hypothetical protein
MIGVMNQGREVEDVGTVVYGPGRLLGGGGLAPTLWVGRLDAISADPEIKGQGQV